MTSKIRSRSGFTLVEILVVMAILVVLMAMLLPAVQKIRESSFKIKCQNNLKQMGLAMHNYHNDYGMFFPGYVLRGTHTNVVQEGTATGFTLMLPYVDQANLVGGADPTKQFDFSLRWYEAPINYEIVKAQLKLFQCPTNNDRSLLDTNIAGQGLNAHPRFLGPVDYALNKGANGSMAHNSADRCPGTLRGVFHIQFSGTKHRVNLTSILDGASNTFAIGEAVSNSPMVEKTYRVLDFANFTAPWTTRTATPTNSHKFYQAWGAATVGVCVPGAHYGHYGSVFGVTAQYGIAPDYIDEPLNAPIIAGTCGLEISEPTGTNVPSVNLPNSVSGFRGLHTNGANFVYCDGAVRFIRTGVDQDTYRAMSTIAGADLVSQFDD